MDFFIKPGEILDRRSDEYQKMIKTGAELACLIYEKQKGVKSNRFIIQHDYLKDGIPNTRYLCGVIENDKVTSYFSPDGERSGSALDRDNITNSSFKVVNVEDVKEKINPETMKIVENIYGSFFIEKKSFTVKDKEGEEYLVKIVENSDSTIGDVLYIDELLIFKNNERIGYLKAKYTTPELLKNYNGISSDAFNNIASIDYSRLLDNYKGRGLGYVMYFHMAQYLNEKDIEFRQSTLCSPSAQRLWDALDKNCSDLIEERNWKAGINDFKMVKFLNIPKELTLTFDNGTPKVITGKKNRI